MPMTLRDRLGQANWQLILAAPVAAGIAEPVEPTPPKLPGTKPPGVPGAAPSTAPAKRADGTPPGQSPTLPYNNTVGAIQPAPGGIPHRAVP